MQVPLQIVFRHLDHSDAVAARIKERVAWLERFHPRIISCRVAVDAPHKHHRQGNLFHVRVDVRVPGGGVVTGRTHAQHGAHEDVYVALHDAFDEARRLLEQRARRIRLDIKRHISPVHGRVIRLIRESRTDGYGFLRAETGEDVYFHSNSVLRGGFDGLRVGSEVRFVMEEGDEGPQASSVDPIGKQGRRAAGF